MIVACMCTVLQCLKDKPKSDNAKHTHTQRDSKTMGYSDWQGSEAGRTKDNDEHGR